VHETTTLLLVTLPIKKFSLTDLAMNLFNSVINNPIVARLPFNLLLMACFADINVSQGSVATYARCGGSYSCNYKFT